MTLKRASFALDSITKEIFRSSKPQIFCIQGVENVHCACPNEQSKLCKTEEMIVHLEGRVMRLQFANRICELFVAYQKRPKFREGRVERKKFLASKCINIAPKKFELI